MNMIGVLSLAMGEKLINTAISSDPSVKSDLKNLSGKTLRVIMRSPSLSIDVLFGDERVRFEPVLEQIFEPQGSAPAFPDCTLSVDDPSHLISLIKHPMGNIPVRGDHHVLMHAKTMFEQFHPDFWMQIEGLIGPDATSHLYLLGKEITPLFSPAVQMVKNSLEHLIAGAANHDLIDQDIHHKKQELLRLQSEIERNQAKLEEIQNALKQNHSKNP